MKFPVSCKQSFSLCKQSFVYFFCLYFSLHFFLHFALFCLHFAFFFVHFFCSVYILLYVVLFTICFLFRLYFVLLCLHFCFWNCILLFLTLKLYIELGSTVAGTLAFYGVKAHTMHYISSMSATRDVLAMAQLEVNLGNIPEGKVSIVKWREKPVFIFHR